MESESDVEVDESVEINDAADEDDGSVGVRDKRIGVMCDEIKAEQQQFIVGNMKLVSPSF